MVTHFNTTITSRIDVQPANDRRVAVRFFTFSMGCYGYVRQIESIVGVQLGQKDPNPRAHRSSGKRGVTSFPLNGGPEGWDFSGTTGHQ